MTTATLPIGKEAVSTPARGTLGYRFTAVPRELLDAIAADEALPKPARDLPEPERRRILNDRLRAVDAMVLAVLITFRKRLVTSCWCAKETIAARIGKTTRTVQASLRRLELHGFIEQVPVASPDPDEPSNRTGWRITLLFVPGAQRSGSTPDRRPWQARVVWTRADAGGEETRFLPLTDPDATETAVVSPLAEQPVSPLGENCVSPKERAGASNLDFLDGAEQDGSSSSPAPLEVPAVDQVDDDDDRSLAPSQDNQTSAEAPIAPIVAACLEHGWSTLADEMRRCAGEVLGAVDGRAELVVDAIHNTAAQLDVPNQSPVPKMRAYIIASAQRLHPSPPRRPAPTSGVRFTTSETCQRDAWRIAEADRDRQLAEIQAAATRAAEDLHRGAEPSRAPAGPPVEPTREEIAEARDKVANSPHDWERRIWRVWLRDRKIALEPSGLEGAA